MPHPWPFHFTRPARRRQDDCSLPFSAAEDSSQRRLRLTLTKRENQSVETEDYALGYAYQMGNGEPVDPAKAWYNFAAAQRVDTKHELKDASDQMSLVATKLSPPQLQNLQAEVARIPVPTKNAARVNMGSNFDSSSQK